MSWRIGLVDVCAIMVLLVVIIMPAQDVSFIGAYDFRSQGDRKRDVPTEVATLGFLQTEMIAHPADGAIAEEFSSQLRDLGRHDMAIRVAGAAAAIPDPSNWRAQSAVTDAFTDRATKPVVVNADAIRSALEWATKAKDSCAAVGEVACPPDQALRLRLVFEDLTHGVEKLNKGSFDPTDFRNELNRTRPMIRTGTGE